MPQDFNGTMLKQLDSMVKDESLIVSYKTLCRKFAIPVNSARLLLAEYVSSQRQKDPGSLSVLYSIMGLATLENGSSEEQVIIAREADVPKLESKLRDAENQVYAICMVDFEDNLAVHFADNPARVEDVCTLLSTTSIICHYVGPRGKTFDPSPVPFPLPVITEKVLKSYEVQSVKVVESIGSSVEALRVKPSAAPPTAEVPTKSASKGSVASWIKSGGLNPKKACDVKAIFTEKREEADEPADESDEEEDFFVGKKTTASSRKSVMDCDEDDIGTSTGKSLDSSDAVEPANETLLLDETPRERRSASPDEPVVIRRRTAQKSQADVKTDLPEEPEVRQKVPDEKKITPFNGLVQVSSDEEEEKKRVVKKRQAKAPVKRHLESDDDDDAEDEQPNNGTAKEKGKWGFDVDEEASASDTEMPAAPKRKIVKGRAKVFDDYGEVGETSSRKKTRKPRKKAKRNDSDNEEEDIQRSPSPAKPEPLRPFLVAPASTTSGKRRKLVNKTSKDEEGYDVVEKVWVEVNSEEEAELENNKTGHANGVEEKPTDGKVKNTATADGVKQPAPKKAEKPAKATTAKGKGGKGVQSSIMSFFKKA